MSESFNQLIKLIIFPWNLDDEIFYSEPVDILFCKQNDALHIRHEKFPEFSGLPEVSYGPMFPDVFYMLMLKSHAS